MAKPGGNEKHFDNLLSTRHLPKKTASLPAKSLQPSVGERWAHTNYIYLTLTTSNSENRGEEASLTRVELEMLHNRGALENEH